MQKLSLICLIFLFFGFTVFAQNINFSIEKLNKTIANNPKDKEAYNERAYVKLNMGDFGGAIEDCEKLLQIDPQSLGAYRYGSLAKKGLGDLKGAMYDINKAIEISSKFYLYSERAKLKHDLGDFRGAIQDYNVALEKVNKNQGIAEMYNPELFSGRGYCKYKLDDATGAISDCDIAIALDPKYALAYLFRGLTKIYLTGNKKDGCADLSKAGELGIMNAYDIIKKNCN
jgi:tetratricopeptide (TPR) repeat protein